jgi:hypothetical protein
MASGPQSVKTHWERQLCILYNQQDATYTMFFNTTSVLHVSGGFSAHHQELIKLYVQPCVLSFFLLSTNLLVLFTGKIIFIVKVTGKK